MFNQHPIISHLIPTNHHLLLVIAFIVITPIIHETNAKFIDHEPTTTTKTSAERPAPLPKPSHSQPQPSRASTSILTADASTVFFDNFQFQESTAVLDAFANASGAVGPPRILKISTIPADYSDTGSRHAAGVGGGHVFAEAHRDSGVSERRKVTKMRSALDQAATFGLQEMMEMFDVKEPEMVRRGFILNDQHPAAQLSAFSAPTDVTRQQAKGAFAALATMKRLHNSFKWDFLEHGRAAPPKISLRRTPLEGLCPARNPPRCSTASRRYRTLDGTCNNARKPRWGSAQMPFNRFLAPAYNDGVDEVRRSVVGDAPLASARFVSLLVHGTRDEDAPVTLMLAQWGQFVDHDVTATAQPRSSNGTIPQCCNVDQLHPSCLPIKVPKDDPWLAPLNVRCLEFLRSAPAQRPDCVLSWREQTNQVTSYLDASQIYSSSSRSGDNVRLLHGGRLHFGRGAPRDDVCQRGALSNQCIRTGDARSSEQPGLLAVHHVMVTEHNRIADELAALNVHWSDEKLFQESRRIVGAIVQHITYREFLTLVLGRDVCRLFDLDLRKAEFYEGYDVKVNPTVANAFSAAAFRFGHSLIQASYMRCTHNHQFIFNNVSLHNENTDGDIGSAGSLHRLLRGLAAQRSQRRDEFITAELTNHLFQSGSFPFGLDLAAINIQRGRDHGVPAYTQWREPCGLSPIRDWLDLEKVVGFESAQRIRQGYRSVDDVDLFVAGLAERPVIGGLVGPTFACIIAQQFSNLRKGDRFWYETDGFESSFTPAQLQSLRQVSLAQLVCRTLGAGTLQPNVFLPHDLPGNERQPCGVGSLAPIDLLPWQERDPSLGKKEERDPFLNPFLTKQESLDLVASNEDLRPNRVPSAVLRPPFSSIHHQAPKPNRHVVEAQIIEPSIIISQADFRPNKTPTVNVFNSKPTTPHSDAVRPNRQPIESSSEIFPLIDKRPNREPSPILLGPASKPPLQTFSDIHRPINVETSAASSIGILHVVVDKTDFTVDQNPSTAPTTINNKLELINGSPATEQTTKRPTIPIRKGQFVAKRKPARSTESPIASKTIANATKSPVSQELVRNLDVRNITNEHDWTNVTKTERRRRDTAATDDNLKLRQMVILTADRKPSFDVEIKTKPMTQKINNNVRPFTNSRPNVIVVHNEDQSNLGSNIDFHQSTTNQYNYNYNRPPTSPRPNRPNIPNRPTIPNSNNDFAESNGHHLISYDVTITTTETFSYDRRPPNNQPNDYDTLDGPYQYEATSNPYITTSKNPFISTPFSYTPTYQRLTATGQDSKLTRPFHKRLGPDATRNERPNKARPTKLDFDDDVNLSPFSNGGLTIANPHKHPPTYYLDQTDNDDDDDYRRPTTRKQSDRLQDDIDTKPGQVVFIAHDDATTNPATPVTAQPILTGLQNFYPSVVLQKFVSTISKYFGYGKQGQALTRREPYDAADEAQLRELTKVIQGLYNNSQGNLTDLDQTDEGLKLATNAVKRLPDYLEHFPNGSIQFDLDGYLRPEFTNLERLKTNQSNDGHTSDDNNNQYENQRLENVTYDKDPCESSVSSPQPIAPLIIQDVPINYKKGATKGKTNSNSEFVPVFIQSRSRNTAAVAFAPIQVLTRPERPDDWIHTKATDHIMALPDTPQLVASENAVWETPKPIGVI